MQKFKINELKPHPRNNEFFDDISGENWDAFLSSVKSSGVIEPIVITGDKVIISGHQRVRACKELGINEIWAEVKPYKMGIDDYMILKELIETNLRQRGIGNTNQRKMGLCIKELEKFYGIRQGSAGKCEKNIERHNVTPKTENELLKSLGINLDRKTIMRYKKLTETIPELDKLISDGVVSQTTALSIMDKLSENEQIKLIESLPVSKKLTQKEVEGYIEKLKEKDNQIAGYEKKVEKLKSLENEKSELEKQISDLKNQEPKEIIKEVIPDDYDKIKLSNKAYRDECKELQSKYDNTLDEIAKLKHQIKELSVNTKNEMEFNQKIVDSMNRFTNRVNDFISDNGGFVWIIQHISELPSECKGNIKQFLSAIKSITDWANDTNAYVEQIITEIKNNGGTK